MLFTGSPRSSAIMPRLNAATHATVIHTIRQTICIDNAFYRGKRMFQARAATLKHTFVCIGPISLDFGGTKQPHAGPNGGRTNVAG
jgi:hypothetical protein